MCAAAAAAVVGAAATRFIAAAPFHSVHRAREAHDGPLALDLGNLMACDISTIDAAAFAGGPAATDAACHRLAQTIFQSLAARLFALPSEAAPVGRIAHLPAPSTVLPREKPIPKPRPPTKWELFAQVRRVGQRVFANRAVSHAISDAALESLLPGGCCWQLATLPAFPFSYLLAAEGH